MTLDDILDQIDVLSRQGRVSYWTRKRQSDSQVEGNDPGKRSPALLRYVSPNVASAHLTHHQMPRASLMRQGTCAPTPGPGSATPGAVTVGGVMAPAVASDASPSPPCGAPR